MKSVNAVRIQWAAFLGEYGKVFQAMKTNTIQILRRVQKAVMGFLNGFRGAGVLPKIGGMVSKFMNALKPIANAFSSGMKMASKIGKVLSSIWKGVSAFGKMLAGFAKFFTGAFKVLSPVLKVLGKIFLPITIIITAVEGAIAAVKEFLSGGSLVDTVLAFFGGIISSLTFGLIKVESVGGFFKTIVSGFVDALKWVGGILGKIGNILWDIVTGIWTTIKGVGEWFASITVKVTEFISNAWSAIGSVISNLGSSIKQAIADFINDSWIGGTMAGNGIIKVVDTLLPGELSSPIGENTKRGTVDLRSKMQQNRDIMNTPLAASILRDTGNRQLAMKYAQQQPITINAPQAITNNTTTGNGGGATVLPPTSTRFNDSSFQRMNDKSMSNPYD